MSKEAIEALESARAHILDAYRIWQADDVSAVPPPKSGAGAVIAKIDAVLSSPIAGEGKVKALEWRNGYRDWQVKIQTASSGPFYQVRELDGVVWLDADNTQTIYPSVDAAKAAAQTDYETRILSALISSPGKDGGQEVEAAEWQGRYWIEDEGRWSNWITNPVGYPWAHEPQEGKSEIRYLYPQPASTALVERLTKALEPFAAAADRYDSLVLGEDIDHWPCKDGDVTLGDLRKASAVLKAKSPSNVGAPQGDDFMHRLIENAFSWAVEDTNYLDPKATGRLIEATRSGMKPEEAREWRSDLPEILARKAALSASTSREGESRG